MKVGESPSNRITIEDPTHRARRELVQRYRVIVDSLPMKLYVWVKSWTRFDPRHDKKGI